VDNRLRALKSHVYRPRRLAEPRGAGSRCPQFSRPKALRVEGHLSFVASKPPKVQLVGLLPAILKPCGPACAQPFTQRNVEALREEEWQETPGFVLENAERAHHIAEDLFRDFGDSVRIEVVGLDSPRGVWLGLRYRIGKGFAVVVDGHEVFRDPKDSGPVKDAVSRALSTRPSRA